MNQPIRTGLTRQLDRQMSVLYYERLLTSRDQELVKQEADEKMAKLEPSYFVRDQLSNEMGPDSTLLVL